MRISGYASAFRWCGRAGRLALIGLITSTTWADSLPSRAVQASPALKISERPVLLGKTSVPAARFELDALAPLPAPLPPEGRQKYLRAGIGRALPWHSLDLATLTWNSGTDGTQFTTVEWHSPGAAAVRLQVAQAKLPSSIRFYLYGSTHPERIYGPYSANDLRRSDEAWLPVVEGDTVRLEIQASLTVGPPQGHLRMARLSHLTRSIRDDLRKSLSELGQAGSCNVDIACPPSDARWRQHGQSVAKYYLTESNGDTAICTGSLLNSAAAAPLPDYFLTAAHCVSTPQVAASMQFYWFFQRATCGGPAPTDVTETFGGATYLQTVIANDMTLVRLNAPPPVGTTRAGWSSSALTAGDAVMTLHHPSGDLKKFSRGVDQGFSAYGSTTTSSGGSHIRVLWHTGTTEGGSSGAGLFNDEGQLVGTLNGGGASCIAPTAPDWYGRFDQAYASLRSHLMPDTGGPPPSPMPSPPSSTPLTSGVSVSAFVAAGNSSFYRITTAADSTRLTVSLSALSADGDVHVYRDTPSGTATCSSMATGRTEEACVIDSPGVATWFIEVDGSESTSFTLTATVAAPAAPIPIAPTTNDRRRGGGGGSMTTGLLGMLALLAALRTVRRERLVRLAPIVAMAASMGCTGTPTAAADRASSIVLAAPTATELARVQPSRKDTARKVGFGREVPLTERRVALDRLDWTRTAAGVAASLSVRSPGARSLRVALRLERDYPGLQITFPPRDVTLPGKVLLGPDAQWSPVIPGDTVVMDLEAPTLPPSGTVLEVPRVSHLQ